MLIGRVKKIICLKCPKLPAKSLPSSFNKAMDIDGKEAVEQNQLLHLPK